MQNWLLGDALAVLAQSGPRFWMPRQASSTAARVDWVFYFVYGLSVFFFLLIVFLMLLFVFRYRRRPGHQPGPAPTHSAVLELTWTIIPLLLVIVIFYAGFKTFVDTRVPPANAYEVKVYGQKWSWSFQYPNGHIDSDLHVPVNTPIVLTLTSNDVVHSFYVPEFRLKMDAVPGRYNKAWFEALAPGEYQAFCAEYCGTEHSTMLALVIVHEPGTFEKWLADASDPFKTRSPAEVGALLIKRRGCLQCHTTDGSAGQGPTFQGAFGREEAFRDGSRGIVDENYIRESILNPQAKIVAGFEPIMPTYQGQLRDREIDAIIDYLKTLRQ